MNPVTPNPINFNINHAIPVSIGRKSHTYTRININKSKVSVQFKMLCLRSDFKIYSGVKLSDDYAF